MISRSIADVGLPLCLACQVQVLTDMSIMCGLPLAQNHLEVRDVEVPDAVKHAVAQLLCVCAQVMKRYMHRSRRGK
jgi:hypothetical protein